VTGDRRRGRIDLRGLGWRAIPALSYATPVASQEQSTDREILGFETDHAQHIVDQDVIEQR
jgi:hypothetical protein